MRKNGLLLRWHLIGLVVAAVLPVIVFSASMMLKVASQEQAAHQIEVDEKAIQLGLAVDSVLQLTITALEVLAVSNPVRSGDLAQFHGLARRLLAAHRAWSNVTLLGPDGEHLVNARVPFGEPLPPLLRPDLPREVAQTGKPIASDMVNAVLAGRRLTVVYVPAVVDGKVKYVIGAATEPTDWGAMMRSQLLSSLEAILLDRQGGVVATTFDPRDTRKNQDAEAVLRAARSEGVVAGGVLVARNTLSDSGWTIVVYRLPESPALFSGTLAPLVSGFVVLLILGLSLALLLGARIARAMTQHAASVRAVGNGGQPLPVDGRIAEIRQAQEALVDASSLLATRWAREQEARAVIEKADRAKDDFIALLSHEIRTPLSTIANALPLLARARPGSDESMQLIGMVERQTGQIARMMEDLLDAARISRGIIELRRSRLNLCEVVAGAAEDHRESMRRAGIEFSAQTPGEAIWIDGDRARLAQIIANLLQNAAKFTPAGGRVSLSVAARGPFAEIRVRDTGAGIDPETLRVMFERFVQGPAGKAAAKGLGVGLALARKLAELHGASVHASSAGLGKGAEFVVTLPVVGRPQEANAREVQQEVI